MSQFSPTPFDHSKTKLMHQFGIRWEVWTKYEIYTAHGSGGVGNCRNRDFGAPASGWPCPAAQAFGQPAGRHPFQLQTIRNVVEIMRSLVEINRDPLKINRDLLGINRFLLRINRNPLEINRNLLQINDFY